MARLLSEQEQLRRAALAKLRGLGIDPYPAAEYTVTHHAKELASSYKEGAEGFEHVRIAGRLMTKRIMGKASFAVLLQSNNSKLFHLQKKMFQKLELFHQMSLIGNHFLLQLCLILLPFQQ